MADKETTLFTISAQVYALDKNQKWTPLTQDIIQVSFLKNDAEVVRILGIDNNVIIVNSVISQGMQYRRPSDTFVQWFDSQHILYGLNLTSVADAEGFEREFEIATGKRSRLNTNASQLSSGNASGGGGGGGAMSKSVSSSNVGNPAQQQQVQQQQSQSQNASGSAAGALRDAKTTTNLSQFSKRAQEQDVQSASGSKHELNGTGAVVDQMQKMNVRTDSAQSGDNSKSVLQWKNKVKDLELQVMTLEGEKAGLNEQIASSAKIISSLKSHIATLEEDLDKFKASFQSNAANVNIWKTQLSQLQDANDELTNKMAEFESIYDRLGELLNKNS
ncbi:hypothetical protein MIR68_000823 [Amoeboaphelidium protococcarum]|nr:hypothetical protein MIR68_000823 [Amoeboaphelidium protococcarum]